MIKLFNTNTLMFLLCAATFVVAAVLILNYTFLSTMDGFEWQEEVYSVKEGDSLWAVSGEYCPKGVDRREWVNEVQTLNGLAGSTIHAGQEIIVLALAKEG